MNIDKYRGPGSASPETADMRRAENVQGGYGADVNSSQMTKQSREGADMQNMARMGCGCSDNGSRENTNNTQNVNRGSETKIGEGFGGNGMMTENRGGGGCGGNRMNAERGGIMNGSGVDGSNQTGMPRRGGQTAQNGAVGGKMLSSDPLRAIQELGFVKTELELYLDTHPNCKTAIDYYHQTVDALNKLMVEYQAGGNPIVAAGSVSKNTWSWVGEPWPWQRAQDISGDKER